MTRIKSNSSKSLISVFAYFVLFNKATKVTAETLNQDMALLLSCLRYLGDLNSRCVSVVVHRLAKCNFIWNQACPKIPSGTSAPRSGCAATAVADLCIEHLTLRFAPRKIRARSIFDGSCIKLHRADRASEEEKLNAYNVKWHAKSKKFILITHKIT